MKSFIVGVFMLMLFGILSVLGILLIPFFLILGILFKLILGFFVLLFVIWFIGKVTLLLIDYLTQREESTH